MLMQQIGRDLPFTDNCFLLGDKIYPNRYPVMTPYTSAQINRKQGRMRRHGSLFNKYIRKYRVCVEHSICKLKCYRVVSSEWRHPRPVLPKVVKICASLVCRRKEIGIVM